MEYHELSYMKKEIVLKVIFKNYFVVLSAQTGAQTGSQRATENSKKVFKIKY